MPNYSGWIKWPGESTYHDYPASDNREALEAILETELKRQYGDFLRTDQEHFSEYWDKSDPTLLIGSISINFTELEWAEHYLGRVTELRTRAERELERTTKLVEAAQRRLDEVRAKA